jgi:hypothetical protein
MIISWFFMVVRYMTSETAANGQWRPVSFTKERPAIEFGFFKIAFLQACL